MMKFLKPLGVVAALGLALAGPASASLVFDDFTVNQSANDDTTNGVGVFGTQVTGGTIFGGYREVFAFKGGDAGSDGVGDRVRVSVSGNSGNFSSDSQAFGYGFFRWDGIATSGTATNLLTNTFGADTSSSLGNLLAYGPGLQVTYNSDADFDITIVVYTATGIWAALQPVTDTLNLDVVDSVLFSELVLISGTGTLADLADTRAVEVVLNGALLNLGRLDMSFLPPVNLVPEPATLALAGLALLGIGAARRRVE